MSNDPEDIAASLERGYILRSFNKNILNMEEVQGSILNKVIGIGTRLDKSTGKHEPVTSFYDSFENNVIWDFSQYPITKYFGITVEEAMTLPINRWYKIRNMAKTIAVRDSQKDDNETVLFRLLKELLSNRGGDG